MAAKRNNYANYTQLNDSDITLMKVLKGGDFYVGYGKSQGDDNNDLYKVRTSDGDTTLACNLLSYLDE